MNDPARFRADPERSTLWVGTRSYPAQFRISDDPRSGKLWRWRQAHVMFENGWEVSLVWGSGTYSTNHDAGLMGDAPFTEQPSVVEMAILKRDGGIVTPPGTDDEVAGYRTVGDAIAILDAVAGWPSDEAQPLAAWGGA